MHPPRTKHDLYDTLREALGKLHFSEIMIFPSMVAFQRFYTTTTSH
jgi:hypothetical protein